MRLNLLRVSMNCLLFALSLFIAGCDQTTNAGLEKNLGRC
jgi:hypothetical protein